MAINIEIKARVKDLARLKACLAAISDMPGETIVQEDTFFFTPRGRLKLRILAPDRGELIYYERQDIAGPKPSHYRIAASTDPLALKALLAGALGVWGIVRKQRQVYRVGDTRIHLDEVDDLGIFLEIEVVLRPDQTAAEGEAVAAELMRKLGIAQGDLLEEAYLDLLERHARRDPAAAPSQKVGMQSGAQSCG